MLTNISIHANLPASDLKRAKNFYEKLGFKQIGEGATGVFFGSGDSKFYVFQSSNAGTNQATAAGWDVEDIEAEMNRLRTLGVVFEEYDLPAIKTVNGIAVVGNEKAAWFKDSEGNILAIAQFL